MALLTGTGLRIIRYCSMADFPFFKMAAVRHLRFLKVRNFNFRSGSEANCASSYQISQRSVEPIRRFGRFSIFKMAAIRHLGFSKVGNFNLILTLISTSGPIRRPNMRHGTKVSRRSVEPFRRYGRFCDFLRWRPSAILDWFYACWDHPRRVRGGLCDCA